MNKSLVVDDVAKLGPPKMEDLDMSIIEGEQWAQDMWKTLCQTSEKSFLNWCKIVIKLGLEEEDVSGWSKIFLGQVEETFAAMVADVCDLERRTLDKIEDLLDQLEKLCKQLHQPLPYNIGCQDLKLFEEQNQLVKKVEEYQAIVDAKKAEIDILRKKQLSCCKSLGKEPISTLEYSPLPTPAEIDKFKKYVDQLELEKFQREETYYKLKEEIENVVSQLNYKPSSDFERLVLSESHFPVTKYNMESLDMFHKHIKEQLKSAEEEISNLRSRIEDLWRMLEIDIMDQADFRNRYTGKSLDTLEAMRLEVKRLEEIRKKNIKTFIEKLRRELDEVWDRCHCSETDKMDFMRWYRSDTFTEDLLDLHEMEVQKWKSYYDTNAKLLGMIEKHTQLWERVMELEENVSGPNRYQNRGGKLLQEEKERNRLSKVVPKMEVEIRELAYEFEKVNDRVFRTRGLTIEEYINHLHDDRENKKKLKLSARKLQRENTMLTPAKSALNLFPSTSTAVTPNTITSTTKRKILATPGTENKRPRILAATPSSAMKSLRPASAVKSRTPLQIPQIKVTSNTLSSFRHKREKRRSSERKKRIERARRQSRSIAKNIETKAATADINNTTYSEFQCPVAYSSVCSPIEEDRALE